MNILGTWEDTRPNRTARVLLATVCALVVSLLCVVCPAFADDDVADGSDGSATVAVVANLYMPADNNPVMDVNAYMTNSDNPIDGTGIPNTPTTEALGELTDNGDGTYTLVLQVVNPAFTLQEIGTCEHATVVSYEVSDDVVGTEYNEVETRICELTILLDSVQDSYTFEGCTIYPTPLLTYLEDVSLVLVVDFDGDGAAAPAEDAEDATEEDAEDVSSGLPTNDDGTIVAGEYTVTANIWFDKSETGLPLNPHLTNDQLPPMDPVEDNATLVVAEDGTCLLYIPILIQARIMTVYEIIGDTIVEVQTDDDGAVTMVVMDLGVLTGDETTLTGTCTASVTIGETAQTMASGIFDGVFDWTWEAQWEIILVAGEATEEDDEEAAATAAALSAFAESQAQTADDEGAQSAEDESADEEVEGDDGEEAGMYDGIPTLIGLVIFLAVIVVGAILGVRAKD